MATFEVKAKENCITNGVGLSTEIKVVPGDLLKVSVSYDDLWNSNPAMISNANGFGTPSSNSGTTKSAFLTIKGANFLAGSLIGSLDGGNTFFGVGTQLEMTILNEGGTLSFYYWDTANGDNSGSITATVAVYKGPTV